MARSWRRVTTGFCLGVLLGAAVACGDGPTADPDAVESPPIESPAGFRLAWPGPGWQLLDAEQASSLYPGALAGAVGPAGAAFVWRESTDQPAHVVVPNLVKRLAVDGGKLETNEGAEISGKSAQRFSIDVERKGSSPLYLRGLVTVADGEALFITVVSHRDDPSTWQPALDALELTEREAPITPLASLPAPDTLVDGDRVLRAGTYHDYARGIAWSRPGPQWRLVVGADARQVDPGAVAVMDREGVTAMLFIDDVGAHDAAPAFADVFWETKSKPVELKEYAGRMWSGRVRKVGRPVRAVTATREDLSVSVVAWSLVGPVPDEQIQAIVGGLDLAASREPTKMAMNGYRDERLGFALDLPAGWKADHPAPDPVMERGSFVRFREGDHWVAVLSAQSTTASELFWETFLQQRIARRFGHSALGDKTEDSDKLGELAAKHLQWSSALQQVDLWLLHRAGRVFAIVSVDQDGSSADLVRKGFKLTK